MSASPYTLDCLCGCEMMNSYPLSHNERLGVTALQRHPSLTPAHGQTEEGQKVQT